MQSVNQNLARAKYQMSLMHLHISYYSYYLELSAYGYEMERMSKKKTPTKYRIFAY